MPLILSKRNPGLVEWMDRPDCDRELLFNTYRQFSRINRLLSGWSSIYRDHIKPIIQQKNGFVSILDIGCGGGDIIRLLDSLCKQDGFQAEFTGIDPDTRSIEFLATQKWPDNIQFLPVHSDDLVQQKRRFDMVISNHLIHHLPDESLKSVCRDAEQLADSKVLFSDIQRSDLGYLSFRIIAPLLFRNSYIVRDGLISIKKSYRKEELQNELPDGWIVQRKFPFRLLATYTIDPP